MKFLKPLSLLTLAVGLALPMGAVAQSEGPYISGAIGGVFPRDSDIDGSGINVEAEYDPGLAGAAAVGTTFGGNWRGEAALSYRSADIDKVSGAANSSGDVNGAALMFNGYYDFNSGSNWTPYVGAGVGPMRLDADGAAPIGGSRIDDQDWVLAAQAIGGVGYRINDRLGLFTDYRFLMTTDADFTTAAGTDVESEYSEHRIMIGLRWSFGGTKPQPKAEPAPAAAPVAQTAPAPKAPPKAAPAPPPPVAAPAPEVPRKFLVFFDWDRAVLTDDGLAIVRAAADSSTQVPITVIEATGHADRSGPARYNLGLSQKRAEAVKAELVRLGVRAEEVAITWKGELEPLVPTADGVREPQNRRVEIVLK